MSNKATSLKDLGYELQLLLGAIAIVGFIEDWEKRQPNESTKFGNIVNYFKDSAYLHARNLLNALTNQYLVDSLAIPKITSDLYQKWQPALEKYVMHISTTRSQKSVSNVTDGVHLNSVIPQFADEIVRVWREWINRTSDINLKAKLKGFLQDSTDSAKNESEKLHMLLGDK